MVNEYSSQVLKADELMSTFTNSYSGKIQEYKDLVTKQNIAKQHL